MNHDSPAAIRELLGTLGIRLKKRWGQNYLINRGARERLITLLDIAPGMKIWEIGPGLGAMTDLLLDLDPDQLTVFEIDWKVIRYLEQRFDRERRFRMVAGDVVRTWPEEVGRSGVPDRLVGNLPYASSSAIIGTLAHTNTIPARAVFTVQKELAERMCAIPGSKSFSSFSIVCQHVFELTRVGDLKPGSFYPAPDVVSSIVVAQRGVRKTARDHDLLDRLVRRAFQNRRKTLRNNIAAGIWPCGADQVLRAIRESGMDENRRAEEYPVEAWVKAADCLADLFKEYPAL